MAFQITLGFSNGVARKEPEFEVEAWYWKFTILVGMSVLDGAGAWNIYDMSWAPPQGNHLAQPRLWEQGDVELEMSACEKLELNHIFQFSKHREILRRWKCFVTYFSNIGSCLGEV
ncbi:hypothetical protein Tco_1499120 [Tanacetum coccineum]